MSLEDVPEEFGSAEPEGERSIVEKIADFTEKHLWVFYLIFFVAGVVVLLEVFAPQTAAQDFGALYDFNYGPVVVYKNVFDKDGAHSEKILVSSQGGAKMLSLFVLVPKALAQSSADISLASNGRINTLKTDPLFRIDALNNDSISLELSMQNPKGKDVCSFLVVMHSAALAGMTQEQMQSVVEAITAKDVPGLDCEKANEIERELSDSIYAAATGE